MGSLSFCQIYFLHMLLLVIPMVTADPLRTFNVVDYGAEGNGKSDCSKAFMDAWKEACAWEGSATVVVPEGQFFASPVTFKGPCKSNIVFELKGTITAPSDLTAFRKDGWVAFQYLNNLRVTGHGTFDGQGASAWPCNQCGKSDNCQALPTSLKFSFINDSVVDAFTSLNSKMFHIMVFQCNNVNFHNLTITAPEYSPNTDGIHVGVSSNIKISDSHIGTGDDCVSIGPGTTGVHVVGVSCGPGHGISIGSLGKSSDEGNVENIYVNNCTLRGTVNGVRVKTWQNSPSLLARNFTFYDIRMVNVSNPVIIDQQYCPLKDCNNVAPSRVQISDVLFEDIWGTSYSSAAVNLKCSKALPCHVELNTIDLKYIGNGNTTSVCSNVNGNFVGRVIPTPCI